MFALKMHIYSSKLSNIKPKYEFSTLIYSAALNYRRKANEQWPRYQRIRNEEREETLQIFRRMCTATPYDGSE